MAESFSQVPRVSVVIATYNRDRLLARSLQSVLGQSEPDLEAIVVDDASDRVDTAAVVDSLGDPRVRLLRRSRNQGPAAARNFGVREARAALVAFQDSDDEWLPDKLAKQLVALGDAGAVTCDMARVEADGSTAYHRTPDVVRGRLLDPGAGFYQTFGAGAQCLLVRRELFERVGGFDEQMRWFEDSDLLLRLVREAEVRRVAEALVWYHATDGLTADHAAEVTGRRRLLEKYAAELRRESPAFVLKERLLLAVKARIGERAAGWRGRPYGPPEPEPGLEVPCRRA
jgi:glycosyltransferase involved in cell wall biosynthesis